MPTNDQDLRALTYLATRLRDETHGCARWDDAGTFACLKETLGGQNLAISIQRVLGHATDPEAKTPGAIKRPFVPEVKQPEPPRETYDARLVCSVCSLTKTGCEGMRDHPFVSVERARARTPVPPPKELRDAIVPTRTWPKPAVTFAELAAPAACADDTRTHPPTPPPGTRAAGARGTGDVERVGAGTATTTEEKA